MFKDFFNDIKDKLLKEISSKFAAKISVVKNGNLTLIQIINPDFLSRYGQSINAGNLASETTQILEVRKLLEWLSSQPPPDFNSFKIEWSDQDLFRVYNKKNSAFSIAGSISCGGRLNIGGSQLREDFKDLRQYGALYFSENIETATKEYSDGAPLGPMDQKYLVKPKKVFRLWDFDKVVESLAYTGLNNSIKSTPVTAVWAYCKVPMQSQVIASWLKNIDGDGFIFDSTKNPGNKNIVLIFRDDADASSNLDFSQI